MNDTATRLLTAGELREKVDIIISEDQYLVLTVRRDNKGLTINAYCKDININEVIVALNDQSVIAKVRKQ